MAADIPSSLDETIEEREEFLNICRSLSYSERIALANGLGVHFITVQRWYYAENIPDEQTRKDVKRWHERGKPIIKLEPCESVSGYF